MTDKAAPNDDLVAAFQIEQRPVRGRIARMGAVVDDILNRHAYPDAVANLLGEACALAALVGASLKFEGRLILQAQGDGPVAFVVADYDTTGALRGYCRFDADKVAEVSKGFVRPGAKSLLGDDLESQAMQFCLLPVDVDAVCAADPRAHARLSVEDREGKVRRFQILFTCLASVAKRGAIAGPSSPWMEHSQRKYSTL